MYCSAAAAQTSARLGWPKVADDAPPDAPEPPGYGDGFRAAGVEPPPWRGPVGEAFPCGCADAMRNGAKSTADGSRLYALEPLMDKYGIQVYLAGHEHNYERLYPILNGSWTASYDRPGRPVHVLTGAGGAYSKDPFGPEAPWDAARSSEWSYSDITVNKTHFALKQRLNTNSTVIDSFVLVR